VSNHGVRVHNQGRRRLVEEIIGRLTGAQLGRLEEELRRERQRRASSAGGEDASRVQVGAAPPLTEVLEYRPHEDGYLQLELRRYIRRDGSAHERGPYWYFQFHEGVSARSSTWARPATRRALWPPSEQSPRASRLLPWSVSAHHPLGSSLPERGSSMFELANLMCKFNR